jgi:hypothetical protein
MSSISSQSFFLSPEGQHFRAQPTQSELGLVTHNETDDDQNDAGDE